MLPPEALARWRALEDRGHAGMAGLGPAERVQAWLERLAARAWCSGGRVGRLLIETGLCEVAAITACMLAQLDAGYVDVGALHRDFETDLDVLAERAPLEQVEEISARLAGRDGPGDADSFHATLAARLLAAARESEISAVLEQMRWHRPLLAWLTKYGDSLPPTLREPLIARAARLVEATHLPLEYHVDLFTQLAILSGDRAWFSRAGEVRERLPPEHLAATPDLEHPVESLAWCLARLGDFTAALTMIADLEPRDRWSARLRLLPLAPDPTTRARMIDELVADIEPLELSWSWLVEPAPEIAERALQALETIADPEIRQDEQWAALRHMRGEPARRICMSILAEVAAVEPGSPPWVRTWEYLLDILIESGCEALLGPELRRSLCDELLARPALNLWAEVGPFVPDDRAIAVLARSHAGLTVADHYVDREQWIGLGLPLLDRVPPEQAAQWLALAADAMALTSIDGAGRERLAAWNPEQQRAIVRARLAQHQRDFLPNQLIKPWLVALAWALPPRLWPDWQGHIDDAVLARQREHACEFAVVPASDSHEQAELRDALERLTATTTWPDHEQVVWVFALLGRCAGEAAITAALAGLVDLLQRLAGRSAWPAAAPLIGYRSRGRRPRAGRAS